MERASSLVMIFYFFEAFINMAKVPHALMTKRCKYSVLVQNLTTNVLNIYISTVLMNSCQYLMSLKIRSKYHLSLCVTVLQMKQKEITEKQTTQKNSSLVCSVVIQTFKFDYSNGKLYCSYESHHVKLQYFFLPFLWYLCISKVTYSS